MYLYEPNSCIMKAGAFKYLSNEYESIYQLDKNTHLFISNILYPNFPGRVFIIDEIAPFKDKKIKNIKTQYPMINVATRNMGITPEALKSKLKVKDGGEKYLFGVTLCDNSKSILITSKVTS